MEECWKEVANADSGHGTEKAGVAESHKEEPKAEAKPKTGLSKPKGKGKKHEPFADQIFEELSSIQRNSQHNIEGENSGESGILNMERDNPPTPFSALVSLLAQVYKHG